jgi:hypothetical protein
LLLRLRLPPIQSIHFADRLENGLRQPYSRSCVTHIEESPMLKGTAVLFASLVVTLAGCKSQEQKAAEETAQRLEEASKKMEAAAKSGQANMGDAMAALGAAMGAANKGKTVETVDFRELKDMLPASLPGMKRTEASGERTAAMGMNVSTAHAQYSNDNGANATITITDIGSMTGLAGMAAFAWSATEVDRETENGYEKTTRFDGHKAMEKYDRSSKSGEMSVLVGDRFIVEAKGNDVDMDALKSAVKAVNLGKLDSMKGQGVK